MQVAYVLQENVDKIAANASGMMRYLSPGLIFTHESHGIQWHDTKPWYHHEPAILGS